MVASVAMVQKLRQSETLDSSFLCVEMDGMIDISAAHCQMANAMTVLIIRNTGVG